MNNKKNLYFILSKIYLPYKKPFYVFYIWINIYKYFLKTIGNPLYVGFHSNVLKQ